MFKTKEEKQKNKEQEVMKELESLLTQDVICLETDDLDLKTTAIIYFINNGYVCVQNDYSSTEYLTHFALTFAKESLKDRFLIK